MADTQTETAAPKADTRTGANAPAQAAPKSVEKAADAAPGAAEKAAPAPAKEAAKASAQAAAAPAKAAARTARRAAKAPAKRTAKAAPARRKPAAAKKSPAPKRAAAQPAAARAAKKTTTTTTTTINSINEGTRTMKNEAKQAADRFQAVFGDVNARAKSAFERNTRIAEELTELTKGNVEALVASTKVAAKAVETIGQEVAEFSRKSFEDASTALKGFADVKSPTDLFRLQSEFARTQFDSMVAESSRMSEAMIKLTGDMFEPITSRYSVAAERVKNAVAL